MNVRPATSTDAPELTPRRCRWCGEKYVAPKGERWAGCRQCQPTLLDAMPGFAETARRVEEIVSGR